MNGFHLSGLVGKMQKKPKRKLMMVHFGKNVAEAVKITEPLVKVLRLVDGERLTMGYIYEAMD